MASTGDSVRSPNARDSSAAVAQTGSRVAIHEFSSPVRCVSATALRSVARKV